MLKNGYPVWRQTGKTLDYKNYDEYQKFFEIQENHLKSTLFWKKL